MVYNNTYKKPAHVLPAPEEVELNKAYAFSFNPVQVSDHYDYGIKNVLLQYHNLIRVFECADPLYGPVEDQVDDDYHIELWMEFSSKGKLHCHGYITICNIGYFYGVRVPQLMDYGTICIKPVKLAHEIDHEVETKYKSWTEYCTKGQDYMNKFIDEFNLPMKSYITTKNLKDILWMDDYGGTSALKLSRLRREEHEQRLPNWRAATFEDRPRCKKGRPIKAK